MEWSSRSGKEEKEESEEGSGGQGGDGTLTSRTYGSEKEEKVESEEGSGGQGGDGTLTSRTYSMEEIARLKANEAPSPTGWVRGLQLKDRYMIDERFDKTSGLGSLLSFSQNEPGTHSFEEEVHIFFEAKVLRAQWSVRSIDCAKISGRIR